MRVWSSAAVICACLLIFCTISTTVNGDDKNGTSSSVLERKINRVFDTITKKLLMIFLERTQNKTEGVSDDCHEALFQWIIAVRKFQPWALKLLDANSRPPGGLASGTLNDLGTYDQCLNTKARNSDGEVLFTGRYCSLYVKPKRTHFVERIANQLADDPDNHGVKLDFMTLLYENDIAHGVRMGVCFPSSCSEDEFRRLAISLGDEFEMEMKVRGCTTEEKRILSKHEYILLCVLAFSIAFVAVGSAVDLIINVWGKSYFHLDPKKPGGFYEPLLIFSAIRNTKRLLNTKSEAQHAQRFQFIHGMRFFSAAWIILGHSYLTLEPMASGELLRTVQFGQNWLWCLVGNAYPAVQTFLFISGFLLSYNLIKYLRERKRNLFITVYLLLARRYIRLTAPLMFVVACWLLVPLVFDGPLSHEHYTMFFASCERNWWKVLAQINNWSEFVDMCLQHSWYVSVDWQIYMFIWIIPMTIAYFPNIGVTLAAAVVTLTSTLTAVQTYANDYQPIPIYGQPHLEKTMAMMKYTYYRPHVHVGSYALGCLMGYLLLQASEKVLEKWMHLVGWTLSTSGALLIIFGPYKWLRGDDWTGIDAALYAGYGKIMWSLLLCWVTFVCATDQAKVVTRFLGWKALVPLSRLSYGAYLINSPLYLIRTGILRERMSLQHFHLVKDFMGCLSLSFLLAYVLFLLCEAPVAGMEKLVFGERRPRNRPPELVDSAKL